MMTELIVALDTEARNNLIPPLYQAGVRFFKLGIDATMAADFGCVLQSLKNRRCDWFFDAKIYDTRDTVERIAGRAFELGARFLTVHATMSMLDAATRAKPPGDYHKVIAVGTLTDGGGYGFLPSGRRADGVVCPADEVKHLRRGHDYKGIIVCPGIRPVDNTGDYIERHNHVRPATPSEAKAAGADYIVVGRPIYDAPDPLAAARAIMEELR